MPIKDHFQERYERLRFEIIFNNHVGCHRVKCARIRSLAKHIADYNGLPYQQVFKNLLSVLYEDYGITYTTK